MLDRASPGLLALAVSLTTLVAEAQQDAADVLELEAVSVTSNQLGTITEQSASYTPGTIATATRLVLTPRETPQSISVVTRQKMDDFGLTSIDDVMRHTPGVSITTIDSERTVYSARGFEINNFQYDGIPMMRDTAYSAGNTLSDVAIYDRVEVLKGATGLLTGSGDPGATINLIRKRPTYDFRGHVTAGIGSWDDYRSELDVSGPLNDDGSIRGRAVAAYQDRHAFYDRYSRKTTAYFGSLEFDLSPDTLLTVGADYQDNDPKGSSWGSIPIFTSDGHFNKVSRSFNPGTRWSAWEQYTRTLFATLEHNFSGGWVGKLQLNHQINGYHAALGSASSGQPDSLSGSGVSLWQGKYVGETVSNALDGYLSGPFQLFGREHELVVGSSLARRETDRKDHGFFGGTVPDFYDWNGQVPEPNWNAPTRENTVVRENGMYLATRLDLHDDWKLILGSRVADYRSRGDRDDMTETGVLIPYAGLIYDLNRNFSLYASYTSIFKPQTLRDRQGSTLAPLEGDSYETGVKGEFFGGRLNTSLAYFEIHQDNYGVADGFIDGTIETAWRAEQGVRTRGYEAEISGELSPGWQLQAGYTHKIARLDGEKINTVAPEDSFSLYSSYRLNDLTLGGGARWQSRSWRNFTLPGGARDFAQEAYWLVDLMARYQITKDLSATLNLNNVLDKKYYDISPYFTNYTWGEPRNMTLSARYDF
ncbi:TonB-dependent siderophore receptor [Pseudomonas sp. NCCP-436]|uniref:TonB-dependent siderophore receptor n=1 Tax=Pseudomonas sp. NCCP-436 TaxID=2842481 RepID=UPI001C817384|nr:TonB-dependent siderophore receptor [Pseudomonas sp. NCCP-436]GIZ12539.1 ferripyoverdine receptor [Pseudomonas sp. NCCP-436]